MFNVDSAINDDPFALKLINRLLQTNMQLIFFVGRVQCNF